jgi:hypothetical protein
MQLPILSKVSIVGNIQRFLTILNREYCWNYTYRYSIGSSQGYVIIQYATERMVHQKSDEFNTECGLSGLLGYFYDIRSINTNALSNRLFIFEYSESYLRRCIMFEYLLVGREYTRAHLHLSIHNMVNESVQSM